MGGPAPGSLFGVAGRDCSSAPVPRDPALRVEVPVDLAAVDGIRTQVVELAAGWGLSELEDLEVVTSELITNAIVHARSVSVVEVRLVGTDCVEVTVSDADPEPPVKRIPYEQHTRGLGLHIVDALSEEWGVRVVDGGGKGVWARVGPFPGHG